MRNTDNVERETTEEIYMTFWLLKGHRYQVESDTADVDETGPSAPRGFALKLGTTQSPC